MGNFVNSLFNLGNKKNKKMDINEQQVADYRERYSKLDFQWIKGENLSNVEKFKNVSNNGDFYFIDFQSGRRVNVDLLGEYMVTFPASAIDYTINPVPESVKNERREPHKESAVTAISYDDSKSAHPDSPIYKLLKKQKKNLIEVSIKIKLNLPPKELYGVLLSSFEDAEKEIIDFVLDGVDIDNIKSSLADSIKKSYYADSGKTKTKEAVKKNNKIEDGKI